MVAKFLVGMLLAAQVVITGPSRRIRPVATGAVVAYTRAITIDHTQVGASDSANFPVLVAGTYPYLASIVNGGGVANAHGYDIEFFADAARTTKLSWELESYSPTTGTIAYWVQLPMLSHTADTVIYMGYGDSSITTDQSTPHSVFGTAAGFVGVWHLPNGTSLTLRDSTNNGIDGTALGTPTAAIGVIGGAAGFGGSAGIDVTNATLQTFSNYTLSAWVKVDDTINRYEIYNAGKAGYGFRIDGGVPKTTVFAGFWATCDGPGAVDTGWHYIVAQYDGAYCKVLLDSVASNPVYTGGPAPNQAPTAEYQSIGQSEGDGVGAFAMKGSIDEMRIASVVRSADWITAEYNNQKNGSTFYRIGSAL